MMHGYYDEAKGPRQDKEWGMVTMMELRDQSNARQGMMHGYYDEAKGPSQRNTRNDAWLLWWS